jgi:hypothetical protein
MNMIVGDIFGATTSFLLIESTYISLGIITLIELITGFGTLPVKINASFSSGCYLKID